MQNTKSIRKKILRIAGVIIVINIIILAVFATNKLIARTPKLLAYIPTDAQQVLLIKPNKTITQLIQQQSAAIDPIRSQQVQQLREMAVIQESTSNSIFIAAKRRFNAQEFLQLLNQQGSGMSYSFDKISDDVYLFANPETIRQYTVPEQQIQDDPLLAKYENNMGQYPILFLSRVNADAIPLQDNTRQTLIQRAEYFLMMIKPGSQTQRVANLIYKQDQQVSSHQIPHSKLANDADTIISFQLFNLAQQQGRSPTDIVNTISYYFPTATGNMVNTQLRSQIVQEPISIHLSQSNGLIPLTVQVVSNSSQLFGVLQHITLSQTGRTQGVDTIQGSRSLLGTQLPVQIRSQEQQTQVTVGQESHRTFVQEAINNNTIAALRVDINNLFTLYKERLLLNGQMQNMQTLQLPEILQDKILHAQIQQYPHALTIQGSIK